MQIVDDGKRLGSGSCDHFICVWNLGGKFSGIKTIEEHANYVNILKK